MLNKIINRLHKQHSIKCFSKLSVNWDKATKSCAVSKFGRLRSSNDARDENGFFAWTATYEWSSGWAFFQGKIQV